MADANLKDEKKKVSKKKSLFQSTQKYLRIGEIRDDVLVLKDGGIRAVLETSSVNFNLKSEEEQNALIYSYQAFLNTLEFPIQIVVESRKLDIDRYLDTIKKKIPQQANDLLRSQTEEYITFVQRLVEYADIMEKQFYVVVPYDPPRVQNRGFFQNLFASLKGKNTASDIMTRHKEFEGLVKNLNQRVNTVIGGLESCGLKVRQLATKELINVYYRMYNPVTAYSQKTEGAGQMALVRDESLLGDQEEDTK